MIKIPYSLRLKKNGEKIIKKYFPEASIRLKYKHQISPQKINAIFDSGSDINLFNSYFGKQIGLNVKKGKLHQIQGIGNIKIPTYKHEISIYIEGKGPFRTTINFSDHQIYFQIIGINTFKLFQKVTFKEKKKLLELTL